MKPNNRTPALIISQPPLLSSSDLIGRSSPQLPSANIKDCFSVSDADSDGKLEFVVKGFTVPDARIHTFIFEATADNTYGIIKTFNLFGGYDWYGGGYSNVGDVDGDSIAEIVLEGCQNVHIIKSAGNDSFYVQPNTCSHNLTIRQNRTTEHLLSQSHSSICSPVIGTNLTGVILLVLISPSLFSSNFSS